MNMLTNVKSRAACLSNHKSHVKSYHGALIYMVLALQVVTSVDGLLCYTCTYRESDTDNTCVVDANATQRITNCSKKYCTIVRQEAVRDPRVT